MRSSLPLLVAVSGALLLASCSDGGGITVTPTDPCAAQNLAFPGSGAGTLAQGAECRVGGRPAAFHRVNVPATGSVEFQVAGDFQPEVAVLTDPDIDHLFRFDNATSVSGVWLLPAGSYLVRVVARSGSGAYTVAGANFTGQSCIERLLVPFADVTYSRQLTASACVSTDDGSFFDSYVVYSTRPCTITMRSAQVDPFLFVLNGRTGAIVTADDDSAGGVNGLDAQVSLAACNAGGDPLEVLANTALPAETGAYTFRVQVDGGPVAP